MFVIVLFMIYGCVLVYFLFFAENMGRSATRDYSLNLIPFHEIKRFIIKRDRLGSHAVWMNIAGNVAAFIPFGLFIKRKHSSILIVIEVDNQEEIR